MVNSTADNADANPGNGVCADANGFCTLRAAVQEANARVRTVIGFNTAINGQTIVLGSQIQLTSNILIRGNGTTNTVIGGNNSSRIFYVTNGRIGINGVRLTAGRALGGNGGTSGGAGAMGAGAALLVHEGNIGVIDLKVSNCLIDNCTAQGGQGASTNSSNFAGGGGGGGLLSNGDNGGFYAGVPTFFFTGAGGAGGSPNGGGSGSSGSFQGFDISPGSGGDGGFGGGGGGFVAEFSYDGAGGGSGGFGGGGGGGGNGDGTGGGGGGNGGFGGGAGHGGFGSTNGGNGVAGFGGSGASATTGGNGAGFGGAVMVVSGTLTLASTQINNNTAQGGSNGVAANGLGKGAGVFVYDFSTYGAIDGKSNANLVLSTCGATVTFSGNNSANNANGNANVTNGSTINDNENLYGKASTTNNATCTFNTFAAFTFPTLNFVVNSTGDGGDNNPGDGVCNNGSGFCTLRAAIQESNAAVATNTFISFSLPANSTITVASQIQITKNVSINGSGKTNLTISGNNSSRIFYITNGRVNIDNLRLLNGRAQGGNGGISGGGGALGAGGAILVHEGASGDIDLKISNVNFESNQAIGGTGGTIDNTSKRGGAGGGGLFGNGNNGESSFSLNLSGNGGSGGSPNGGAGGERSSLVFGGGQIPPSHGGGGGFGGGGGGGGGGLVAEFNENGANGGSGGFGGGGGSGGNGDSGTNGGNGGSGGFGCGAGRGGNPNGTSGSAGFGGSAVTGTTGGNGAGFGGAIFVVSGDVTVANTMFMNNSATATGGASGKGAAIGVYDFSTYGAVEGKSNAKLTLSTCGSGNTFSGSNASSNANSNATNTGGGVVNDNEDVYGKVFSTSSQNCSFTTLNDIEYLWSNGATTATINNLTPGSYTLSVTDNIRNCTGTNSTVVNAQNPAPNPPTLGSNPNVVYNGVGTISLTFNVANPGSPNVIDWYNAATEGTFLGTGNSFTNNPFTPSPPFPQTVTLYAETRNTTSGCISTSRTAVSIVIRSCSNASPIISSVGTHTSAFTGTDGTYTYYCDANFNLLLALDLSGSGAVVNANQVSIKIDANPFSTNTPIGFLDNPNGGVLLQRKWEVDPATQPSSNVRVKFYFTNAELNALISAAGALLVPTSISTPQELQFYKVLVDKAVPFPNPGTGTNDVNVGEAQFINNGVSSSTSQWLYEAVGSNHAAIYQVTSFSGGGGGTGANNQELPVELLYFKGTLQQQQVLLAWSTASEYNNKGFEIERSEDGKTWKTLDFVEGNGTAIETQTYEWLDKQPFAGINYYRLKQLDFDGVFEYSDVIAVFVPSSDNKDLLLLPNPTDGTITLRLNYPAPIESIQIFDGKGTFVKNITILNEQLDLSDLPNGNYTLVAVAGGKRFIAPLVKQ